MDETKKNLAEGPGSVPRSDYRHGQGGNLGVEIDSYQPAAVAPAALHLSQVPESMRSVGNEPPVEPLRPTAGKLVYEPEAGTFVPEDTASTASGTNASSEGTPTEGLLDQVVHKAEGILSDVKDLAGTALGEVKGFLAGPTFGEMKEKASGAWHSVAGTIGAGPGKELAEDNSERVLVSGDESLSSINQRGVDLGVDVNSHQPSANAPAGIYPHGEIRTGDKSGHRPSEVVGEDTMKP